MRQTITRYTDIRDELQDFLDFIQDVCCDIGGVVDDIDDQLDTLCERTITYNELLDKSASVSDEHPSTHVSPAEEDPWPFPLSGNQEAV